MPAQRDFQAVVLAGGMRDMMPFVNKSSPKALLPVGNRPLLSYPLEMLEKAGFCRLLLVVAGDEAADMVGRWATDAFAGRLKIDVAAVPEDAGSAGALRAIAGRITTKEFLLVSGDLVCDIPLGAIVAAHHLRPTLATALIARTSKEAVTTEQAKKKAGQMPDIIGLDKDGERLLFCAYGADIERHIYLRRSIFRRLGQVRLFTNLRDMHLYVFTRKVLEILVEKTELLSIKGELLPPLVASQDLTETGSVENLIGVEDPGNVTRCSAFVADSEKYYCHRINSVQAYCDVNRDLASSASRLLGLQPSPSANFVDSTAEVSAKAGIGQHCIVGAGTRLADKSSVKRSVIGRNCRIGYNAKINNSVIMNDVVIGDHAEVQGCVVASGAQVLEGCKVVSSQIGPGFVVSAGASVSGESLSV